MKDAREYADKYLRNVHPETACAGRACTIHNPTDHAMRDWDLVWRDDRGFFERGCECGIGHPDPDTVSYWVLIGTPWQSVHGCCGICH